MLAERRLGDAEFLGDEQGADPVLDEVAVLLGRKMGARLPEPMKDRQPAFVGERLEDINVLHFVSLQSN